MYYKESRISFHFSGALLHYDRQRAVKEAIQMSRIFLLIWFEWVSSSSTVQYKDFKKEIKNNQTNTTMLFSAKSLLLLYLTFIYYWYCFVCFNFHSAKNYIIASVTISNVYKWTCFTCFRASEALNLRFYNLSDNLASFWEYMIRVKKKKQLICQ